MSYDVFTFIIDWRFCYVADVHRCFRGRITQGNTNIIFDNETIQTDCTVTANEPTNTITLRRAGIYLVQFTTTISNTTSLSEFVGINMKSWYSYPRAYTSATSSFTDDLVAVLFSTLVRVKPSCHAVDNTTRLQFKVTGAEDSVYFANVVMSKVK